MKKNRIVSLLASISLLVSVNFCSCPEPPSSSARPSCESLKAVPIAGQYVIYVRDSFFNIQGQLEQVNTNAIFDTIITVFVNQGDSILKKCMCEKIFLMEAVDTIDPQERVREAESKLGSSGDEIGEARGYAGLNYPVNIVPIDNLPSVPSDRGTVIRHVGRTLNAEQLSVVVAITDTGFKLGNGSDLDPYAWINKLDKGEDQDSNCIVGDFNGADVFFGRSLNGVGIIDGHGHAVAGKTAGLPNAEGDYSDTTGYPDNIQLQLMNVKFTHEDYMGNTYASLFDAICALRYAVEMEAAAATASWGGYLETDNPLLSEVLRLAKKRNVTIIAAAGNDSINIDSCPFLPASYAGIEGFEHVISVGAFDSSTGNLADFSNYGATSVLLVAPGSAVEALSLDGDTILVDGTSIAVSYVAKTTSIIKAYYPEISPDSLRTCLLETTLDQASFPTIRYGRLNHFAAIDSCLSP